MSVELLQLVVWMLLCEHLAAQMGLVQLEYGRDGVATIDG